MVVSIPKEKKKNPPQIGLVRTLAPIIKMKMKKSILFRRRNENEI
jgi:hypothetical protein